MKSTDLNPIQVHHLKDLRVAKIIAFARTKVDIDEYIPTFKQEDSLPDRKWIWNVGNKRFNNSITVNTLIPEHFKAFVKEQIKKNDVVRIAKRKEEIDVMPEFYKLFKESETISSNIHYIKLGRTSRKIQ